MKTDGEDLSHYAIPVLRALWQLAIETEQPFVAARIAHEITRRRKVTSPCGSPRAPDGDRPA